MKVFWFRGGSTSTRSEALVEGTVVSCLGLVEWVGKDTGGYGSEVCRKRAQMIRNRRE